MPLSQKTSKTFWSAKGMEFGRKFHTNVEHQVNCLTIKKTCKCNKEHIYTPKSNKEELETIRKLFLWIKGRKLCLFASEVRVPHGIVDLVLFDKKSHAFEVVELKTGYKGLFKDPLNKRKGTYEQKKRHCVQAVGSGIFLEEQYNHEYVCQRAWILYVSEKDLHPVCFERKDFGVFHKEIEVIRKEDTRKK